MAKKTNRDERSERKAAALYKGLFGNLATARASIGVAVAGLEHAARVGASVPTEPVKALRARVEEMRQALDGLAAFGHPAVARELEAVQALDARMRTLTAAAA